MPGKNRYWKMGFEPTPCIKSDNEGQKDMWTIPTIKAGKN